jgi:hypothetical protein
MMNQVTSISQALIAVFQALYPSNQTLKGQCLIVSLFAEDFLNKYAADGCVWEAVSSDDPCFGTSNGGHGWVLGTDGQGGQVVVDLTAGQYGQLVPYVHAWHDSNYPKSIESIAYLRDTTAYKEMLRVINPAMLKRGF